MNIAAAQRSGRVNGTGQLQVARGNQRQSLVEAAVVVAETTDAATGSRLARQLAAMSGRGLTVDEQAAIEAAVRRAAANGNKG